MKNIGQKKSTDIFKKKGPLLCQLAYIYNNKKVKKNIR